MQIVFYKGPLYLKPARDVINSEGQRVKCNNIYIYISITFIVAFPVEAKNHKV